MRIAIINVSSPTIYYKRNSSLLYPLINLIKLLYLNKGEKMLEYYFKIAIIIQFLPLPSDRMIIFLLSIF